VAELFRDAASMDAVLRYHMLSGRVMMADLVKLQSASTMHGVPLTIAVEGAISGSTAPRSWVPTSRFPTV